MSSTRRAAIWCCCASNEEGYRNLSYLVSMAFVEGFYIKPRIDLELLRAPQRGAHRSVAPAWRGKFPGGCATGSMTTPRPMPWRCAEIFGEDNFYLELQDHGIRRPAGGEPGHPAYPPGDRACPWWCTNDAHYLRKSDAEAHDVLLCIQTGKTVDDENRMRYEPQNFYLRSTEEMEALFPDYPEAVENTEQHRRAVQSGIRVRQVPSAGVPAPGGL